MDDRDFDKQDMERNEDTEKVAGAVTGATSAGVGAAIGLAALGPLGGVIGALAGAAGGWWAGTELQQAVHEMDREENRFRRAHDHAGASRPYEEARHGYQLGYLAGRNPYYEDRTFTDVEQDLRTAWVQAHLEEPVPWQDVRADAKSGYELARGRD